MSAATARSGEALLSHADITDSTAAVGRLDPTRLHLLSEFLALQPSAAMCRAAEKEETACRVADRLASRLTRSRDLQVEETPSEKMLIDSALAKCSHRVAVGMDTVRTAEDLVKQQRVILAMLYPSHSLLDPVLQALVELRKRNHSLRKAIRDQTQALAKLSDASNLLLMISDHVQLVLSCYAHSCTSSSSSGDWSSEDGESVRVGCLGRSEDSRSMIYISSVPGNYRIRYLRKCWGFAAEALSAAVALSSYLSRQLEREGQSELVPGIEAQARPTLSLFELPGGLTFVFRSDLLQKMLNDAKTMREVVESWYLRQRKFISRVRKDLSRSRKKVAQFESKLADLRRTLLSEEFADSCKTPL